MILILPIIACFIPLMILFFILLFGFKTKITHLLITFVIGLLSVLPVSIVQYLLAMIQFNWAQPLYFVFLQSLLVYGLIEELFKLMLTFTLPQKDYTPLNFLLLSFFFGLSLGCFESVIYFLDHFQKSAAAGGMLLYRPIFVRMFTSDLIHMTCAGLLGIFVYQKRKGDTSVKLVVTAILLHGIYDFFAGFANGFKYFSIVVILFALIQCRVQYSMYNSAEK